MPVVDSPIGELKRRFMSDECCFWFELRSLRLIDLLKIYEKVCNIDRQLLKAEIKTFKPDATVLNILNPDTLPSCQGSYNRIQICRLLCVLHWHCQWAPLHVNDLSQPRGAWKKTTYEVQCTCTVSQRYIYLLSNESDIVRDINIAKMIEEFSHSSHTSRRMQLD